MWIWGILGLFDQWTYGVIPLATFILLNYLFYRRQILSGLALFLATAALGGQP
jgi:hypothetical protein